jgi:hypothetical protein
MCQVEVVFYVETAARWKVYPLDILPASSLIGRVPSVNWVTHRIQTSSGLPFWTVAQRQRVSVKVKRSLTYSLGLSSVPFSFSSFWDRKAKSRTVPTLRRTSIPKYLYVVISN